jgi:ATP phosphoribosyltransferase
VSGVVIGIPSKGRLMDATVAHFAKAGLVFQRDGAARGYRGALGGITDIEIAFLSASEIAGQLKSKKIDAGITGEDLLRESLALDDASIAIAARLPFGYAAVVVGVPACWIDAAVMSDLDDISVQLFRSEGRRLRVATKYKQLTRRHFAAHGVTGYRIVESAGATEGAPAAGTADVIVDITTTGATLAANHLKILDDGVVLKSSAVLAVRREVAIHPAFLHLVSIVENIDRG